MNVIALKTVRCRC